MNNWYRRAATVAAGTAVVTSLGYAPASAWQGCDGQDARCRTSAAAAAADGGSLSPFAQPVPTLGGRTLAEYLTELRVFDFRLIRPGS